MSTHRQVSRRWYTLATVAATGPGEAPPEVMLVTRRDVFPPGWNRTVAAEHAGRGGRRAVAHADPPDRRAHPRTGRRGRIVSGRLWWGWAAPVGEPWAPAGETAWRRRAGKEEAAGSDSTQQAGEGRRARSPGGADAQRMLLRRGRGQLAQLGLARGHHRRGARDARAVDRLDDRGPGDRHRRVGADR